MATAKAIPLRLNFVDVVCDDSLKHLYVNGKKANILGKICMDQCIVDLTDIKDVSMDSEVIFYGNGGPNLLDVANLADTNRNELLSIVSRRVDRVYIKDKKIYKILDYLS